MAQLRRLDGVLAGTALSSTAIAICLGVTWLRRNHQVGGNGHGAMVAIAAVAAVSAVLLAVTALFLLRERTPDTRISNGLTASAVFVSLVPLEVVLLNETWVVFVSSALLAVLVVLVLSQSRLGSLSIAASQELAGDHPLGEVGTMPTPAPLSPQANNGRSDKPRARDQETEALRRGQVRSSGRSFARRTVFDPDATRPSEKAARRTLHLSRGVRCIWDSKRRSEKPPRRTLRGRPSGRPRVHQISPGAPPPERVIEPAADAREEANALSERLLVLSQELDHSIERLDRICSDIDVKHESATPASTQQEMDLVAAARASDLSKALTSIVSRLDALCERLEPCVDGLERLGTGVDERLEERPPPAGGEATESTRPQPAEQPRPAAPGPDQLGFFREQVEALVSRLQRGIVGDRGRGVELQVIRSLRERLDGFLQKLEAEDRE
jgi:hypothetical protein